MDDRLQPCNTVSETAAGHSETEFEELLVSIGWGTAYRAHRAAVDRSPQSEPAVEVPTFVQTLPEAVRRTSSRPAIGPLLRYAFATFLVLCVVLHHPLSSVLEYSWARLSGQTEAEAQARAMLARARLMALSPGTTVEEVRERVGLPTSRGTGTALMAEEAWYYGVPPTEPGGSASVYTVAVSKGKVVRVVDITQLRSSADAGKSVQCAPRYYGDLRLQVKNRHLSLRTTSDTAVLLIGDASGVAEFSKARFRVVQVECVTVVGTGREIDVQSPLLYWRGMLYPLPACTSDISADALVDDLKWLLRSVGCDEVGKEMTFLSSSSEMYGAVTSNPQQAR